MYVETEKNTFKSGFEGVKEGFLRKSSGIAFQNLTSRT